MWRWGAAGLVLFVAVRYRHVTSRFVASDDPEKLLLVVPGLTILIAGVAQQLQVSAAVGAFLVGIALSGEVAESAHTLLNPLRDLFAAVFFVFFGLHTGPASIPPVLLPALAPTLLTAATKIATGYWSALPAGFSVKGRWRPRRPGGARRVLDRHRRAGGEHRHRAVPGPAGHGIRPHPGRPRPPHRPLHRASGAAPERAPEGPYESLGTRKGERDGG